MIVSCHSIIERAIGGRLITIFQRLGSRAMRDRAGPSEVQDVAANYGCTLHPVAHGSGLEAKDVSTKTPRMSRDSRFTSDELANHTLCITHCHRPGSDSEGLTWQFFRVLSLVVNLTF